MKEGHPEVGSEGVHVEFAGDTSRREEETGPAVSVQRPRWGPLEIVSGIVARDCELLGQLRTV